MLTENVRVKSVGRDEKKNIQTVHKHHFRKINLASEVTTVHITLSGRTQIFDLDFKMNDQMYKQNKKVMSSEYGGDNILKSKQKNSRKERFPSDLSRTCSTVTSERSNDENLIRTIAKRVLQFIFSQVCIDIIDIIYNLFILSLYIDIIVRVIGWGGISGGGLHCHWRLHLPGH